MSFSFGTPSSAPATTGVTAGFSFGANKPATPGFGLTATTQQSGLFGGTPATSAAAFGTPSFGSTSFGTTTTPAFGAAAPAFGTSAAAPAFGTTTPAFGAATSAPTFGTTPATGLTGFGATTTPSFGLGTGGLNFGSGTSTSAPSTGLSFGAPTTAAPSLGLGGFSFAPASTQSAGFSLFNTSSTTTSSSLFGPKLGLTSVAGTLPSTSATPSLGLGGLAHSTSGIGATNANTDAKSDPPKQQKLPNEIATTVESFKDFVKKQKALSSEVMRVSVKPLHSVSRQAEGALRGALALRGAALRTRAAAALQRRAAAAAVAAAEGLCAHPGSELEAPAPPAYVKELIAELEQKLIAFRAHMDSADKQMQSSPKLLTEQELHLGFRRMHEALVALAGRLQNAHAAVRAQRDQYRNLRKYILKDPADALDAPAAISSLDQILKELDGTAGRKKIKSGSAFDGNQGSVVADPRSSGHISLAGPSPFGPGGLSRRPADNSNAPTWQPQSTASLRTPLPASGAAAPAPAPAPAAAPAGFQLQKPPGKRGKQ